MLTSRPTSLPHGAHAPSSPLTTPACCLVEWRSRALALVSHSPLSRSVPAASRRADTVAISGRIELKGHPPIHFSMPSLSYPSTAAPSPPSAALDTAVFPSRIAAVTAAGEMRLRAPHMLVAEPLGSIPGLTRATLGRSGLPLCSPSTTPPPFAVGEPPSSARPPPSCLLAWTAGHSPSPVMIRPPTDAGWHGGARAALPRRRHRPHRPEDGRPASHRPPPLFPVPGGMKAGFPSPVSV
jgi:hypothetical protein